MNEGEGVRGFSSCMPRIKLNKVKGIRKRGSQKDTVAQICGHFSKSKIQENRYSLCSDVGL